MKESLYGPCGLYCGACGATDCGGCMSGLIDDSVEQCTFRKCATEKKVELCCYCDEYPCPPLQDFMNDEWPHHWTIKANLEQIKQDGILKWLTAQHRQWTCQQCGAGINWYQKECPCGQPLEAWDLPDIDNEL